MDCIVSVFAFFLGLSPTRVRSLSGNLELLWSFCSQHKFVSTHWQLVSRLELSFYLEHEVNLTECLAEVSILPPYLREISGRRQSNQIKAIMATAATASQAKPQSEDSGSPERVKRTRNRIPQSCQACRKRKLRVSVVNLVVALWLLNGISVTDNIRPARTVLSEVKLSRVNISNLQKMKRPELSRLGLNS